MTDEPKFLNEIQVKVECHACDGNGTNTDYEGKGTDCFLCEGRGFLLDSMEDAILCLVKANLRKMMKNVIGD